MEFVRLIWVDVSGVRRCRCIPRCRFSETELVPDNVDTSTSTSLLVGPRLCKACIFLPCWGDVAVDVPGVVGVCGEVVLHIAPNAPFIHRGVLPGTHDEMRLVEFLNEDGSGYDLCPRSILKRSLELLKCFGLELNVGFELEFVFLKGPDQTPVDDSVYCQTSAYANMSHILSEICAALSAVGQKILQVHGESAPGQFEIATQFGPALEQADHFILRKEIIQCIAQKHGFEVSFLPKLFESKAGSAAHCHWSLCYADGSSAMSKGIETPIEASLTDEAKAFMSGILNHLPSIIPFTAGSCNSFRRMQPSCWAGAYACWGVNNREAALRLVGTTRETLNVEFKVFDGTSNPYLGIAAIIAAGICGLKVGSALIPPVQKDPRTMEDQEKYRLPKSLSESLVCLSKDSDFQSVMRSITAADGGFIKAFVETKTSEVTRLEGLAFEDEIEHLCTRY